MTSPHLAEARAKAQQTYDRRRARDFAEALSTIPPARWDDATRAIIITLATLAVPSRIDDVLDELIPLREAEPVALCGSMHGHDSIEQAKACDDLPRADTGPDPESDTDRWAGGYDSGVDHPADDDEGTPDIRVAMAGELRRMGLMDDEPRAR